MTDVCLGIDPSTTRLGLALVEMAPPHRALWAETVAIDKRDGGWLDEQIREALRLVPAAGAKGVVRPSPYGVAAERNLARVGIERAINHKNPGNSYDAGGVYHLVLAECRRRWPWAVQVPLLPTVWKKDVLGKGNATKQDVFDWALDRLWSSENLPLQQDSADAICVAVSAAGVELVDGEAA